MTKRMEEIITKLLFTDLTYRQVNNRLTMKMTKGEHRVMFYIGMKDPRYLEQVRKRALRSRRDWYDTMYQLSMDIDTANTYLREIQRKKSSEIQRLGWKVGKKYIKVTKLNRFKHYKTYTINGRVAMPKTYNKSTVKAVERMLLTLEPYSEISKQSGCAMGTIRNLVTFGKITLEYRRENKKEFNIMYKEDIEQFNNVVEAILNNCYKRRYQKETIR